MRVGEVSQVGEAEIIVFIFYHAQTAQLFDYHLII